MAPVALTVSVVPAAYTAVLGGSAWHSAWDECNGTGDLVGPAVVSERLEGCKRAG